jgi:hypothetical protein
MMQPILSMFLLLSSPTMHEDTTCFAKLLCAVKDRIRWRTPAWSAKTCEKLGDAIQASASEHKLNPHLLLGILVNESELDEKSHRDTYRDGKLVAKDGGLGGMRCVLGQDGKHCVNGFVRGMSWQQIMDPVTNIEMAARELARHHESVACRHKGHAWWNHFNHGVRYIDRGPARHYGHRVAVLYAALLRVSGESVTDELRKPITIVDKGQKPRSIDKPVGVRQRRLVGQIMECARACTKLAFLGD